MVNALVLGKLDASQQSGISALLDSATRHDGHAALPEPQRVAVARSDLGGGTTVVLAMMEGAPVGCAVLSAAADGPTSLHLVVDPAHRDKGGDERIRTLLMTTALASVSGQVRLWAMRATPSDDAEAARFDFVSERDVLQMRVALPLPEGVVSASRPIATRSFVAGQDDEALLSVNNRAFEGHPEQGGWTMEQFRSRRSAPWVDLGGILMADAPDGSGLIGSCWTKIHRNATPVLGEIYVIAVDPSHHGQGWGRALTVAGLTFMAQAGVTVGMLYTDASNDAAVALYRSLGFTVDHVDRSYIGDTAPRSA